MNRVVLENMHYSINPDDIKIEKLGHIVTNIWNIKQYRTNLALSIFFADLKPAPKPERYIPRGINTAVQNSNRQNTKGILLNVQIAKGIGTPKTIVTSNHGASNAQVTI
jgi:hypothetical protein